jgi:hypothetical protein
LIVPVKVRDILDFRVEPALLRRARSIPSLPETLELGARGADREADYAPRTQGSPGAVRGLLGLSKIPPEGYLSRVGPLIPKDQNCEASSPGFDGRYPLRNNGLTQIDGFTLFKKVAAG